MWCCGQSEALLSKCCVGLGIARQHPAAGGCLLRSPPTLKLFIFTIRTLGLHSTHIISYLTQLRLCAAAAAANNTVTITAGQYITTLRPTTVSNIFILIITPILSIQTDIVLDYLLH